jgi:hypothetical protein
MTDLNLAEYVVRSQAERDLLVARREPKPHRARRFVCVLQTPTAKVKAFDISFLASEPGVMVMLDYFRPAQAVLGRYRNHAVRGEASKLYLVDGGKVTGLGVKMSFHLRGECLFSRTRQVRSEIRTQAVPLDRKVGHLFTVHARGPAGFGPTEPKDELPSAAKRTVLTFAFEEPGADGLKVTGWWYPERMVGVKERGMTAGPAPVRLETPDGVTRVGFLLAPPKGHRWDGYRLLLAAEPFGDDGNLAHPFLLIIGGFSQGPAADGDVTTMLAAMYTDRTETFDELTASLGTIDLDPPEPIIA